MARRALRLAQACVLTSGMGPRQRPDHSDAMVGFCVRNGSALPSCSVFGQTASMEAEIDCKLQSNSRWSGTAECVFELPELLFYTTTSPTSFEHEISTSKCSE